MKHTDTFSPRHFAPALAGRYDAVDDLEYELARFTGHRYAVCVSSGTAALALAMAAYGTGGRAAAPAHTFPAIRSAMRYAGVMPVWDDCGDDWQTHLDPPDDCRFLLPVHNYGVIGTHGIFHSIENWRDEYAPQARIITDCAGALLTPNAFVEGDAWCASFNWNKAVSGGGGGALITDDLDVAAAAKEMRRHEGELGFNLQMSALCASEALSELLEADVRRSHLRNLSLAYDLELEQVGLSGYPHGRHRWLTGTMLPTAGAASRAMDLLATAGYMPRKPWLPLTANAPRAWDIYSRGIMLPGGYQIESRHVREVCQVLERATAGVARAG